MPNQLLFCWSQGHTSARGADMAILAHAAGPITNRDVISAIGFHQLLPPPACSTFDVTCSILLRCHFLVVADVVCEDMMESVLMSLNAMHQNNTCVGMYLTNLPIPILQHVFIWDFLWLLIFPRCGQ
jgi:hypothetical protein